MYCLNYLDPYVTKSDEIVKEPVGVSLIMAGKNTWRYLNASWRNEDTYDLIFSIYGFYFQKLISRSFSGLFQLFR